MKARDLKESGQEQEVKEDILLKRMSHISVVVR